MTSSSAFRDIIADRPRSKFELDDQTFFSDLPGQRPAAGDYSIAQRTFEQRLRNQLDSQQISSLTDRYAAPLTLFARQWCRCPEDAVQNAFLDLMQAKTDPSDPAAWLFTTVRRKALNIARGERRIASRQRAANELREPWFETDQDRRFVAEEIEQSLEALPELERQVIVARVWGELSFAQIADALELSSSAVHRRYQHALAMMSKLLSEETRRQSP